LKHPQTERPVAVIGLGYVGLPLAVALGHANIPVIGIDLDPRKIERLNRGESYIADVPAGQIAALVEKKLLTAHTDYDPLCEADSIFICVPTPFDANKAPDLTAVKQAAEGIAPRLRRGQMIVLQSTTYPGTTEEVVLPILEKSGLEAGVDFDLAFSPERIDPGNQQFNAINTPKVVGGVNDRGTQRAATLLKRIGAPVEIVSSTRAAEMTKLLENIFRSVNIALVNEMARFCNELGIDLWDAIRCASTKPFGYQAFYPGPGVGGHCIPIDPNYLSHRVRTNLGYAFQFVELAQEINAGMPAYVARRTQDLLNEQSRAVKGSTVLLLGVTYKANIADQRESPAVHVAQLRGWRRPAATIGSAITIPA